MGAIIQIYILYLLYQIWLWIIDIAGLGIRDSHFAYNIEFFEALESDLSWPTKTYLQGGRKQNFYGGPDEVKKI